MATETKPMLLDRKPPVRMDVESLLRSAVEHNAGVDTLEKLVGLAERVRADQARSAWYEAMSEFQRRCPEIKKTSKADISTARGFYSYKFAPLDEIMSNIRPLLGELGLSVFWSSPPESPANRVVVSCRVAHVLGHVEESGQVSLPVPDASERGGGNPLQRIGSALSYARRYSLMSIMGISPEDDDDAQANTPPKKPVEYHRTPPAQNFSATSSEYQEPRPPATQAAPAPQEGPETPAEAFTPPDADEVKWNEADEKEQREILRFMAGQVNYDLRKLVTPVEKMSKYQRDGFWKTLRGMTKREG